MLTYSEILPKKRIILDGEPYEVISARRSKKGRGKASNQVKLKNLITGRVIDKAFHQADSIQQADVAKKEITYLYCRPQKHEYWFSAAGNPKERFSIPEEVIGESIQFAKEGSDMEALIFNMGNTERIIGIRLPIKVDLRVTEAPPGIRGNTAQGGTKQVILETGAAVNTPLFINEGDIVRINTETGEYAERVGKK